MKPAKNKNADDYLELIYTLSVEGSHSDVRIKEIAEGLSVYPSTATEMVQKLSERGLIVHNDYGGVRLTESGIKHAESVLSRHRILECFFVNYLKMDLLEVQGDICGMEHHLSPAVLLSLYEKLGRPKTCPHGKPIPTSWS